MKLKSIFQIEYKEFILILVASIILGLSFAFLNTSIMLTSIIYFLVLISLNIIAKKITAFYYEADIKTKFWRWYQFWFRTDTHFKKPIPMLWLPPLLAIFSKGYILWLGILKFDIKAKAERVSKRHGLYRFSEMTEWHIALITAAGVALNLLLAIISYFIGLITFAKLNLYFAFWSLIPISDLDGSKILFGSKMLWTTLLIITSIFLIGSFVIV